MSKQLPLARLKLSGSSSSFDSSISLEEASALDDKSRKAEAHLRDLRMAPLGTHISIVRGNGDEWQIQTESYAGPIRERASAEDILYILADLLGENIYVKVR